MVGCHSRQTIKNNSPPWLDNLLESKFFRICLEHESMRKNEINIFCIDCNLCICQHCFAFSHSNHKNLQIRRYVYHDVILLHEIHKLVDCSRVQSYTINRAKAVFLNPRLRLKPAIKSAGGAICENCDRCLTEPNRFCSIACKVRKAPVSFSLGELPDFCSFSTSNEENTNGDGSPPPSSPNSSQESDPWMNSLKPRRHSHKRKGIPCRSPIF